MKRFFLFCEIFLFFSLVAIANGSVTTGESSQYGSTATGEIVSGEPFGTGEVTTGIVVSGGSTVEIHESQDSEILITEVFFDGRDERIELYNHGAGSFSGTLRLEGVKRTPLILEGISIGAGEVILITDKIDSFTGKVNILLSGAGLNMPDTEEISIVLSVADQVEDTFVVSRSIVSQYNDKRGSFYKGIYDNERLIGFSSGNQEENILDPYIGHPGIIVPFEENTELVVEEIITCPNMTGNVELSEIFLGDDKVSMYFEIYFAQHFSGQLVISGSSLVSSLFLDIDEQMYPGDYLIVTNDENGFNHDQNLINVDNLLLARGGLQISRQNGQVLDSVVVELDENTSTYYVSRVSEDCRGRMESHFQPTPGFSETLLKYIDITPTILTGDSCPGSEEEGEQDSSSLVDISLRGIVAAPGSGDESLTLRHDRGPQEIDLEGYYILRGTTKRYLHGNLTKNEEKELYQNYGFANSKGGCVTLHEPEGGQLDDICYTKDQVDGFYKRTGDEAGESGTGEETKEPEVEIEFVDYDPPGSDVGREAIVLRNLNGVSYDAKELWLQVGDRSSKTYIAEGLNGGVTTEVRGNFRFPNQDTCILLMYQEKVLDVYCYETERKGTTKDSVPVSTSHPKVKVEITAVDYDPEGVDTNRESVTLRYVEGDESLLKLGDFRLLVGKQKKTLPVTLSLGQEAILTKTFGFPNTKITCVTLMHGDKAYDVFCYDPQESEGEEGIMSQESKFIAAFSGGDVPEIQIVDVVYDPEGRDEGNESISFVSLSSGSISFSGFVLEINGKQKKLRTGAVVTSEDVLTLTGTFGFLNAGACVSLLYEAYVFDTKCYGEALTDLTIKNRELSVGREIAITDVLYDPDGSDIGKESISFMYTGSDSLDLSSLVMLVNGKKRSLNGIVTPGVRTTFQSNYRFPNAPTCIELFSEEVKVATYCYGMVDESNEQGGGDGVLPGLLAKIVSIVYDPPGVDVQNESITIAVSPNIEREQISLMHKGKTYTLDDWSGGEKGEYVFTSTFDFPNRIGCVDLQYNNQLVDRYCYSERQTIGDVAWLEEVSDEVLSVLNTITLKQDKEEDCLVYKGHRIACKDKKTTKAFASHDKFYTSYIQSVHDYLYYAWPVLYYHTDMRQYMTTYRAALKQIRSGEEEIQIGSREYSTTDFAVIMADQYIDSYYEWFVQGVESVLSTGESILFSG